MIAVSGAELRPGDRIMHPRGPYAGATEWRHVCTVKRKPKGSPGVWSLGCEVRYADGSKGRISVGPTQVVHIERKGAK